MKFSLSASSFRTAWQNNRPFILLLFYLLLIHSFLKIIFYYYNHDLLLSGDSRTGILTLIKWSLLYDLLVLLAINAVLLFLLQFCRLLNLYIPALLVRTLFVCINTAAILLNLADVFYYRFRFQRASADLLYVIDHPFRQVFHFNIFIISLALFMVGILAWLVWLLHKKLYRSLEEKKNHYLVTTILLLGFLLAFLFRNSFSKLLLPAYPLEEIKAAELPLVQNSAHTFIYSVFRGGDEVMRHSYFTTAECDSLFPVKKKLAIAQAGGKKNIVLFIMESVPYDFFDSSSRFKVTMPFFDSLLQHSSFFSNGFCFLHESNKGITAILAGIPTLTDIPLYHSHYVNMPVTAVGKALRQNGYHSLFCIGDEYDNFGFAKCMNWLGIDRYYSKEDIPGYKDSPAHPMGLQDEVVLPFFFTRLQEVQQPFLGIQYNISTHYPYDLPRGYNEKFPDNYTEPMRAMQYYDHCLGQFFNEAKSTSWFSNTVFIFCSDHWMFPQGVEGKYDAVAGYRIPIIVFDPASGKKETNTKPVSQFDVLGTILATAGYKDSIISYGGNLLDSVSLNGYAFSKAGASLYQVTDSSHVLGFNTVTNKVEYLYNYKEDVQLRNNLVSTKNASAVRDALLIQVRSFIQKAGAHYNGMPFH